MIYTITLDSSENTMGKGIDVSRVLKKLGVDSVATGIIHKTQEKKIDAVLDKAEIGHDFINPGRAKKISASTQQELLDYLKKTLKMGDIIVVAGKFAEGIDPLYLEDIAMLVAKKTAHLVVDVPYVNVRDILPLRPLLIKPNVEELKSWFDKENEDLTTKQLVEIAHDMVVDGADHVLLSLGEDGAAIVNMMHAFVAKAPEVQKVNEVGAGETLLATFLAGMMKSYTPVRNLADSIAAATDTVQKEDLTEFENTAELQRKIMAEKVDFEEAE